MVLVEVLVGGGGGGGEGEGALVDSVECIGVVVCEVGSDVGVFV